METTSDDLIAALTDDIARRGPNSATVPFAISYERHEASGKWEWLVIVDVHIPRGRYISIESCHPHLIEALATARRRLAREYPIRPA